MSGARFLLAAALTSPLWPSSAAAQPSDDESTEGAVESSSSRSSIKGYVSTERVKAWLAADDNLLREQALKRLGVMPDAQAVELLIRAVQPDGQARTPRLRMVALRSLTNFLKDAAVRRALVTVMSGAGQPPEAARDPMETLVRQTAAMGLAASQQTDALMVLGKSLRQGGPSGLAAAQALVAYPPSQLKSLLTTASAASTNLIDVLGALRDQRAFNALRRYVVRGTPEVRAHATIVLTEMGHMETVELARHWLEQESMDGSRREAAVRVLSMTHADDAAQHLGKLLKEPGLGEAMLGIAYELPDPRFAPALIRAFKESPLDKSRLIAAIGRAGSPQSVAFLGGELKGAEANRAAYALALVPHEQAEAVLVHALSEQRTRRVAARALVIRAQALGSEADALRGTLEKLLASDNASDRAAGAFGLSSLYPDTATELIGSEDRAVVLAAARNAHHGSLAITAARRLAVETDTELCLALSNALSDRAARHLVPSSKLLSMVESGSAAASLAVRTLGSRLAGPQEPRLNQLAEHQSPVLRAEFALGLGDATAPAAMGLLLRAYEFETDAVVRRSIVSAISARSESNRTRLLDLALRLDPDQTVRQLAQLAKTGHNLISTPGGHQTFWLNLRWRGEDRPSASKTPVVLQGSRGHTLVAFADPDGFVGMVGLDAGPLSYLLAEPGD